MIGKIREISDEVYPLYTFTKFYLKKWSSGFLKYSGSLSINLFNKIDTTQIKLIRASIFA